MLSVVRPWVSELPLRMQAVLLLAMRGPDGVKKENLAKQIVRELRFVVLNPALPKTDGTKIDEFMGTQTGHLSLEKAMIFAQEHDEYPHHWLMHLVHAAEIVGQYHPDTEVQTFWWCLYQCMTRALHLNPEDLLQLEARLGPSKWELEQRPPEDYQYLTVTFSLPKDDVDAFVGWLNDEVQAGNDERATGKITIAVEPKLTAYE